VRVEWKSEQSGALFEGIATRRTFQPSGRVELHQMYKITKTAERRWWFRASYNRFSVFHGLPLCPSALRTAGSRLFELATQLADLRAEEQRKAGVR
jgi:hypothetical protein